MNCARNIITANFSGGTSATTAPLWQWDYGQVLCITGIEDLPAAFEVHFSTNKTGGVSTTAVGADGQVTIPNVLLTIGKNLNAWIYLSDSEGEGETEYSILIPVKARPMPETYDAEVSGEFDDVVRQVSEYAETAQTAADNAGASASAAAASASEAAASASAASAAKTAAEIAQGKAEDAQAAAETAAQTATQKAQQTDQDAAQAAQSKADAESAAERAEAAQTGAESAKADAETAAQGAADSASAASASATSAGQAATSAGQSATAAAQSAASIEGDVQTATQKAAEATAAAGQAVAAKDAAQTAQTAAETAETNAGQSASTATTKAGEAAQSASSAAQSKTDAEAAATRAEQAAATLTVDDALSDTSENPVQNKVVTAEITQVKNAIDALKIVDTASGAIASFPDGAAMPVEGLTVDLEPIQDLNGQDAPYPAGGGKNLFDKTATNTDNGYVANYYLGYTGATGASSNYNVSEYIPVKASTAYTLSPCAGNASGYCFYDSSKTYLSGRSYANNATVTFTTTADAAYIRVTIPKANIDTFQLEEGSTATSYAPYENICPISGRDAVTAYRSGKNLWNGTIVNGFAPIDNLTVGETYTCTAIPKNTNATYLYLRRGVTGVTPTTESTTLVGQVIAGQTLKAITFTVENGYSYYLWANQTSVANIDNVQIEVGSTPTAYEAPQIASATIQLGQTVYGGSTEIISGQGENAMALATFTGGFSRHSSIHTLFYRNNSFTDADTGVAYCNQYKYVAKAASNLSEGEFTIDTNYTRVVFKSSAYSGAANLNAYLAEHPLTVAYPLATPTEITTEPVTLSTLKGTNNVWSDAGDVSVEYVADPKLYIARLTEPDADMVADANITAGSYFMVGNNLYLATSNIASGAAIVPGVNCTRTNLAAALNAINA